MNPEDRENRKRLMGTGGSMGTGGGVLRGGHKIEFVRLRQQG